MKRLFSILTATFMLFSVSAITAPLGTGFTYQGELQRLGIPANGTFDFEFNLFDVAVEGAALTAPLQLASVNVQDGVFTVELDFGAEVFDGTQLWLEITVGGSVLAPRQQVSGTAYAQVAIKAEDASSLGGLAPAAYDQSAHTTDSANPHGVTAGQVGAVTLPNVDERLATHKSETAAHHAKTTSFGELADQAGDAQIPDSIARDSELHWSLIAAKPAGFADNQDNDQLNSLRCQEGQVAKISKKIWVCASDATTGTGTGSGDITSVNPGVGLTGGADTGDATLALQVPLQVWDSQLFIMSLFNNTGTGLIAKSLAAGEAAVLGLAEMGPAGPPYYNYGGRFEADGTYGAGVYGLAHGSGGRAVFGQATGAGIGVSGKATTGIGGLFNSSSGPGLVVETGNVGIGKTDPVTKVDVSDKIRVSGYSTPASGKGLELGYAAGTNTGQIYAYNRDTGAQGNLFLGVGNVGIGPNASIPQYPLHVDGDTAVTGEYRYSQTRTYTKQFPPSAFQATNIIITEPAESWYPSFLDDLIPDFIDDFWTTPPVESLEAAGIYIYDFWAPFDIYGLQVIAPVDLPDGAEIVSITAYFRGGAERSLGLEKRAITQSEHILVAVASSSNAMPYSDGIQVDVGTNILPAHKIIDNRNSLYTLRFLGKPEAFLSPPSLFYGASIEYKVNHIGH